MANVRNVGYAFVVCAGVCATFEGLSTTAYHDTLAHGLPTVCYGETEGVRMTDRYTPQECKDMLAAKLPRYWHEIAKCIRVPVSMNEQAAYTSFSYNVGSAGFCRSTTARLLNEGKHKQACRALMAWDHASGHQVRGLTRRRAAERDLCLTPDPYVCTPNQAERGECLPLIATAPPVSVPLPAPRPHVVVCHRYWWFWKVCK